MLYAKIIITSIVRPQIRETASKKVFSMQIIIVTIILATMTHTQYTSMKKLFRGIYLLVSFDVIRSEAYRG